MRWQRRAVSQRKRVCPSINNVQHTKKTPDDPTATLVRDLVRRHAVTVLATATTHIETSAVMKDAVAAIRVIVPAHPLGVTLFPPLVSNMVLDPLPPMTILR